MARLAFIAKIMNRGPRRAAGLLSRPGVLYEAWRRLSTIVPSASPIAAQQTRLHKTKYDIRYSQHGHRHKWYRELRAIILSGRLLLPSKAERTNLVLCAGH